MLYFAEPQQHVVVLAVAGALALQGGYTLAMMSSIFDARQPAARRLQLAGSTLALISGAIVAAQGLIVNFDPANGDPEYGPMTVGLLIAAHGLASLLAFTREARAPSRLPGIGSLP